MSFREEDKIPGRRNITRDVSHYSDHRNDLKIDFKERCGYCNDIQTYRFASFEIDHFIPRTRNKQPFLTIKSDKDYSNLVYSCKACNGAKSNKWPSEDQNVPHQNNQGFIDPCDTEYDKQFMRLDDGQIYPRTSLGKWMWKELKLHKPQHMIIYNIEKLDSIIDSLTPQVEKLDDIRLCKRILNLSLKYREYIKQLGDI